jgi:hypothetical protein
VAAVARERASYMLLAAVVRKVANANLVLT